MSYFNSLSSYKATQTAVAQHTTDMEQSVKDGKAAAAAKAYEGYSQLLETAGGSTTGLAGGFHLTRKIYKKYQAKKQASNDEKEKANQDEQTAKNQDAEDDKDADDELGEPEDFSTGSTAETTGTAEGGDEILGGEKTEVNTQADELDTDTKADEELGEPEDFTTGNSAPPTELEGKGDFDTGDILGGDKTEANTQGEQTTNDLQEADNEAQSAAGEAPKEGEFSRGELGDSGGDVSGGVGDASDTFGGDIGSLQQPTQISGSVKNTPQGQQLGEEPDAEKTGENQLEGDEPDDADLPDPVDYDIKSTDNLPSTEVNEADQSATKAGGDSTGTEIAGDTEESADRIEQGANMFSKITPTPTGGAGGLGVGADAGADDIVSAGSSLLSDGLEVASTALDFLGPVGEVVGAGIALGGFFHSLFDGGESKKESDDEDAPTDISQGGGISATSLQTQSQSSNMVGTSY